MKILYLGESYIPKVLIWLSGWLFEYETQNRFVAFLPLLLHKRTFELVVGRYPYNICIHFTSLVISTSIYSCVHNNIILLEY